MSEDLEGRRYRIGDSPELDAIERAIMADVEEHVFAVMPVIGDEEWPSYAYSIGLHRAFAHPEIVVFGTDPDDCRTLIDELGHRVEAGERMELDRVTAQVVDDLPCMFLAVDSGWYETLFGRGIDFYGTLDFPVIQCVWSDEEGQFPWDAGYDAEFRGLQPILTKEPAD